MNEKTRSIIINIAVLVILSVAAYFTASGPIKIIASIGGIICVYLVAKESVWNYPVGLIGNSCLCYTLFQTKLYADAILQIMFMVLMVFGWIFWLTGRSRRERVRPAKHLTTVHGVAIGVFIVIATIIWGGIIKQWGDPAPYFDAFTSMVGISAQYLLSSRVYENWYGWFALNGLSLCLYAYKGLYLFSVLYFFYLLIAIGGMIKWRKSFVQ
ncbi:nicotinamide riboside transporter PnuC [Alicyclobacillus acidoterrestris]|uniref:Nicotinamide riboside transporter PnuC n=1 Tax=Alicyclobacillus acidoterrestris (strain ATCC 49025 / DSM 3922 / CIP 106132 / NCIMB 13137 / GD3B) TaxID=1356854 RepID=T0BZ68_ALIAG|nr:nicotinamide riboside transporter PnuC [Alicyclobacillus acidoterrestris]EPZ45705.1 hypothetical protein N007_07985 [Alicyclobacillus acidoterrestris ATCC 49025]UNO50019.1 nicotinamide riboside transporter PnuC [Alicyclobacillus acidoterrestris]GEO25275.1 nicotinamide mononucleotide transporter [Alicyclobacillus acidoterrestris]